MFADTLLVPPEMMVLLARDPPPAVALEIAEEYGFDADTFAALTAAPWFKADLAKFKAEWSKPDTRRARFLMMADDLVQSLYTKARGVENVALLLEVAKYLCKLAGLEQAAQAAPASTQAGFSITFVNSDGSKINVSSAPQAAVESTAEEVEDQSTRREGDALLASLRALGGIGEVEGEDFADLFAGEVVPAPAVRKGLLPVDLPPKPSLQAKLAEQKAAKDARQAAQAGGDRQPALAGAEAAAVGTLRTLQHVIGR